MFAFFPEGEVIAKISTVMIATEEMYRVWMAYFQRPEIQQALKKSTSFIEACFGIDIRATYFNTEIATINIVS